MARTTQAKAKTPAYPHRTKPTKSGASAPPRTKAEAVITLLKAKQGATIAELMQATGWQAHSVRGFLAGSLKTRHSLQAISDKPDEGPRRVSAAVIGTMPEDRLHRELADLAQASRTELIARWRRLLRCEPPRYASLELLRRAAAYAVQERALGGLSASAKRQLTAIARGETQSHSKPAIRVKPGTRLLREWHGTTHEVIVTDTGFVWEGRTYRSLSAVAQVISGAKWSGRRFFGLVTRRAGQDG